MKTVVADYLAFNDSKIPIECEQGIQIELCKINPALKMFNRKAVQWSLAGGRRALFFSFGLHKTVMQIEKQRLIGIHRGGRGLIVIPLGVRQEFFDDAARFFKGECSIRLKFIQSTEEVGDESEDCIYLTNYESIREGKIDVRLFTSIELDEADCLRSFGSKTFSEFLFGPVQNIPMRGVNTATPSPNDYQELLAYAHFLGVMEIGEARTRFFQRNSEKADDLTLLPAMEDEFWMWVSSWALFVTKPSQLGDTDEGYILPELDLRVHVVASDHRAPDGETNGRGQGRMFKNEAVGVVDASREKKLSLPARLAKLLELRSDDPDAHRILWHDLESEREAIERAIPTVRSVYGNQNATAAGRVEQESIICGFRAGEIHELAAKPVMLGGGCNFQRHCNWAIFLGIGFKFRDFIQAIHRLRRFGQTKRVRIDLIYTELERPVFDELMRKWQQHERMVERMTAIVEKYGLSSVGKAESLKQASGVVRQAESGELWESINNDTVLETMDMEDNSVGLIVTSPPFSNQYRYSANFYDFGHNSGWEGFLTQMDFLTPELLRVLQPGRVCAVHCKDRIVPGEMIGESYQTVDPFHAHLLLHFMRHGFTFLGMLTIVTDVVKENNGTYRLSYSQMLKDGSRMGFGLPEYVLAFRKRPTDSSRGFADCPVAKSEAEYPLSRWQIDAHGFWRSSGDRSLTAEDLIGHKWSEIIHAYRHHSQTSIYDYALECEMAAAVDADGNLPRDFMLLQPQSWHPDVWTDVFRAGTLNRQQASKGREKHLCPLQYDIVDRLIDRYSNPGELVFDPFAGIGTVPVRAVKYGRRGRGHELNPMYWQDGLSYLRAVEAKIRVPSLFDALEEVAA